VVHAEINPKNKEPRAANSPVLPVLSQAPVP
jgi:hypothetical protein